MTTTMTTMEAVCRLSKQLYDSIRDDRSRTPEELADYLVERNAEERTAIYNVLRLTAKAVCASYRDNGNENSVCNNGRDEDDSDIENHQTHNQRRVKEAKMQIYLLLECKGPSCCVPSAPKEDQLFLYKLLKKFLQLLTLWMDDAVDIDRPNFSFFLSRQLTRRYLHISPFHERLFRVLLTKDFEIAPDLEERARIQRIDRMLNSNLSFGPPSAASSSSSSTTAPSSRKPVQRAEPPAPKPLSREEAEIQAALQRRMNSGPPRRFMPHNLLQQMAPVSSTPSLPPSSSSSSSSSHSGVGLPPTKRQRL